jgi:flagellar biosynthesis/type III secretory pathway M-ring protein FliF/YscJ
MTIDNTGKITWKPSKSQSGTVTFNVVVSDGEFSASTPVTVKVKKAQEATFASMMLPILLILIIVVAAIVLLALAMRKKPSDKDEDEDDEEEEEDAEEKEATSDKKAGKEEE